MNASGAVAILIRGENGTPPTAPRPSPAAIDSVKSYSSAQVKWRTATALDYGTLLGTGGAAAQASAAVAEIIVFYVWIPSLSQVILRCSPDRNDC